jgi:hypothetical protein
VFGVGHQTGDRLARMEENMPNKGGLSWTRASGVTRAKQDFSRRTGIPLTKSGRQRKIGKMFSGGGCSLPLIIIVSIFISIALR